jgi:hypothetical protein
VRGHLARPSDLDQSKIAPQLDRPAECGPASASIMARRMTRTPVAELPFLLRLAFHD